MESNIFSSLLSVELFLEQRNSGVTDRGGQGRRIAPSGKLNVKTSPC